MSEPDRAVFWSLPEALAWGQKRDPPDAFADFILTLHGLCHSGRVHAAGRRLELASKPLRRSREKVAQRPSVEPRPGHLSEPIPNRQWEDLHFDIDGKELRTGDLFSISHDRRALGHTFNSRETI
jgi:hypothetical protein